MISPRRPNTFVTGDVAAPGSTHNGTHPDIERICPLEPRIRLILFPALVTPLENVRIFSLVEREPESVDISDVLVETVPERVFRFPERVETVPDNVPTVVVRAERLPEQLIQKV